MRKLPPARLDVRIARIIVRGTGLLLGILCCLMEYLFWAISGQLNEQRRIWVLQRWSKFILRAMRVSIEATGTPIRSGLIASNHLSYLDIMVYSAVAPCAFIAKREVRTWPAIGWIATLAGTIYVDRSRRSETHTIQPEIQAALADGLRLVLFPEGTSSDGSRVLHFHSSLFQPAVDLQASVIAASIAYTIPDSVAETEACYWGDMTLLPHVVNLLGKHSVMATVKFSPHEFRFNERKQAAQQMQSEVERLRGAAVEAVQ
ncbi:MAG TPA: lysophospholipid acyltransferase family protein [Candidatus Angelobacter sp.]|nr:lysophospholipid acyltransferase family protein [Candidatus Angelobacter sp.]